MLLVAQEVWLSHRLHTAAKTLQNCWKNFAELLKILMCVKTHKFVQIHAKLLAISPFHWPNMISY